MTSNEQAERRIAENVWDFFANHTPVNSAGLASALSQPEWMVVAALMDERMTVATASLIAHALGRKLVPTPDGRAMMIGDALPTP